MFLSTLSLIVLVDEVALPFKEPLKIASLVPTKEIIEWPVLSSEFTAYKHYS